MSLSTKNVLRENPPGVKRFFQKFFCGGFKRDPSQPEDGALVVEDGTDMLMDGVKVRVKVGAVNF